MPRPAGWQPYRTKDGKEVPSVTTILDRFKASGGLIHWAWQQGKDGLDYRDTRDAAGAAGTLAHAMVEAYIRKKETVAVPEADDEIEARAVRAFENFRKWATQSSLKPVATEVRVVSEALRVGGTLDAMLVDGELALGDWKSSDGVYPEYLLQLAAYGLLWEETHPDRPITGGYHLIRFSKTNADFAHYHFGELQDAAEAFTLMRRLWDLDKTLKNRLR